MTQINITKKLVTKLLHTVDQGLVKGVGKPIPGQMCVEAAVCYALGMEHGDQPNCVDSALRRYKIRLNDSNWSSNAARASGMRRLAVLQLGTSTGFNTQYFVEQLALRTITILLSKLLNDKGYTELAERCAGATTLQEARYAANAADAAYYAADAADAYYAADAAKYASKAAAYAAASYADDAAYYAADAAKYAAYGSGDEYLLLSAKLAEDILIEMNVPAIKYLDLIK